MKTLSGSPTMKRYKLLSVLPLAFLSFACSIGANDTSDTKKQVQEICSQYKSEQITKDEALDRLGLKDQIEGKTVDGSIDTDELIFDTCDPSAAKDRGDVQDGV